ncbi:hypothetical protein CRYUN_Cryun26dG0134900 [Craigia yunnanensis]
MVGTILVKILTSLSTMSSTLTTIQHSSPNILPYLRPKPRTSVPKVRAMSDRTKHTPPPASSKQKNPLAIVLDIPSNI